MARSSLRVAYNNLVTASVTVTPSSPAAAFPVQWCQNDFRGVRTRSAADSDVSWVVDLGAAAAVTCAAILDHNITSGATVEVRASTDNFGASDVLVDTLTLTELASPVMANVFASASYRYWKFRVQDAANPSGYIEFSRLFLGTAATFTRNYEFLWSRSYEDTSERVEASNSVAHGEVRPKRRRPSYAFKNAPQSDGDLAEALFADVGITQPFLSWHDPDNAPTAIDVAYLAAEPVVQMTSWNRYAFALQMVGAV